MMINVTQTSGPVTRVVLAGRLDAPGADAIDLQFTAAVVTPQRHAVVDLSQVEFIASMGLRLLISAARALHLKGCRLVLFGASELVQGVFDDTALDQIIPIVATEADALAAIAAIDGESAR